MQTILCILYLCFAFAVAANGVRVGAPRGGSLVAIPAPKYSDGEYFSCVRVYGLMCGGGGLTVRSRQVTGGFFRCWLDRFCTLTKGFSLLFVADKDEFSFLGIY